VAFQGLLQRLAVGAFAAMRAFFEPGQSRDPKRPGDAAISQIELMLKAHQYK
jgi:hypothetical protein